MTAIKAAGGTVVGAATDIGSLRQAKAIVRLAVERFGRLDILINNASVLGPRALIVKYPVGEWLRVLRCNLTGTFYVSREAARIMVKQRRGRIITLSSSVGRIGRAEWGAYAVSKFGVEGLTQVMANELSPFGISVMTFNPGATRTAMRAKAHPEEDPRRLPDPAAPAEALLRLAVSQDPSLSGKAFDLHNVPLPESIASR
jgi:NAD(P)-dependent dehydrogenase (short-subunit alcohol dehydrogenase family)